MAYLSKSDLSQITPIVHFSEYIRDREMWNRAAKLDALGESIKGKKILFLSHSHYDKDIVLSARTLFERYRAEVYIDWLDDPNLPETTNTETAQIIKDRINLCYKFVMLASVKALNSKWVPWELGIADSKKGLSNVAIIPLVENSEKWPENEYVGLYSTIQKKNIGPFIDYIVVSPDKSTQTYLGDWLKN